MEMIKMAFDGLSPEEKLDFFKQILPDICACCDYNPETLMQEMMPVCFEVMPQFLDNMKQNGLNHMTMFMKMMQQFNR